jgi:thiamine transporter ThiT
LAKQKEYWMDHCLVPDLMMLQVLMMDLQWDLKMGHVQGFHLVLCSMMKDHGLALHSVSLR